MTRYYLELHHTGRWHRVIELGPSQARALLAALTLANTPGIRVSVGTAEEGENV